MVSWAILSSMRSCSWRHHSSLKGSPRHLESLFLFLAVSVCAGLYILAWRGQRSAYVGHLLYPVRRSRAYWKLLHVDSQSSPISYNVNESGHQPIPKPVLWVFELLCRNKEHFQLLFTLSNIELHLIFNKRVSTTWKIKIASPTQFLCQYWNFDIITWTFDSWKAFFSLVKTIFIYWFKHREEKTTLKLKQRPQTAETRGKQQMAIILRRWQNPRRKKILVAWRHGI